MGVRRSPTTKSRGTACTLVPPRFKPCHHPASVMVWWGVAYDATTKLHFCEKEVKTSAKVYENTVLEPIVKPLNNTLFSNEHCSFKQDLTLAHKTNSI